MTMNFRLVKAALVNLLGAHAGGHFRVIGYQKEGTGAAEVTDLLRTVQVFYSEGKFPKSGGRVTGPTKHDMTFMIVLTVGSATKIDLSVLDNPASTPAEKAQALTDRQTNFKLIDDSWDELADLVYQILMDNRYKFLDLSGPDDPRIGSRWVTEAEKRDPEPRGGFALMTGSMDYTCNVDEPLTGAQPTEGTPGQLFDLENQNEDLDENVDTGKAGVIGGG